jgi:hypothetical protein
LFIFAFVCTTGISSVFCALGDMTYTPDVSVLFLDTVDGHSHYVVPRTA